MEVEAYAHRDVAMERASSCSSRYILMKQTVFPERAGLFLVDVLVMLYINFANI